MQFLIRAYVSIRGDLQANQAYYGKSTPQEHSVAIPTDFRENAEAIETQLSMTGAGRFARIAHAFRQDPRLWFGVLLLLFVIAAIFAPIISPYSPLLYHPSITGQGTSLAHLMGTDELGRDKMSRVIYGTRISLSVVIATILMGGVLGTLLGIICVGISSGSLL